MDAHEFSADHFCGGVGEDAVDQTLERRDIGGRCACAVWVFDEISPHSESDTFHFCFLRAFRPHKTGIGRRLVCWDFMAVDEIDGVGALDAPADSLGEAAKFVGGGSLPYCLGSLIGDELAVFESFACEWVDDCIGELGWCEYGR
eukprot:scaffold3668_cov97-Cylindrotheca_fusiformis.AAC.2